MTNPIKKIGKKIADANKKRKFDKKAEKLLMDNWGAAGGRKAVKRR